MADATFPLPAVASRSSDGQPYVLGRLRDESDGTFSVAERSRLEGWDGSDWVRLRVNAKGHVLTDRGNAGAETTISANYTTSQTATVMLAVATNETAHVTSILAGLHASASAVVGFQVKIGATMVARHPGLPAGGGVSHTDLDVAASAGDDITFTCDTPTGGSIDITVGYWIET